MHGLLYENQEDLTDEDLRSYATRLELDLARFDEDLAGHRHAGRVQENRLSGERDGVRGTPGIFLNGAPYRGPWSWRRCSKRSRRPPLAPTAFGRPGAPQGRPREPVRQVRRPHR
jgi:hypothetical protein